MLTRRRVLRGAAATGASVGAACLLPAWARAQGHDPGHDNGHDHGSRDHVSTAAAPAVEAASFDLTIARTPLFVDGRQGSAVTINGGVPAPLLRWREGQEVTLNVTNQLDEDTSLHWHGILLPNGMDGVPGVTFAGIAPGETFVYRFPVRQAGTYWYHSHSGFQEQSGVYGPIVIDPAGGERVPADREYVVMLSDWTFESPERVFANLKREPHYYNYQRRTLGDLFRDARRDGWGAAVAERRMWGEMRMSATDLADVTGATYTYLVNGLGPASNWTGLFRPGERVRLRFINASAMTYFDVRIPGLPMTVVAADGIDIEPVETDEIRIAVAETYDVIVAPPDDRAYTVFAESLDRSGYARGTLATADGMAGEIPQRRERPVRSMADMGHGDHGAGGASQHEGHDAAAPAATPADHAGHGASAEPAASGHDMTAMVGAAAGGAMMDHAGHEMSAMAGNEGHDMSAMVGAAASDATEHAEHEAAAPGTSAHADHGAQGTLASAGADPVPPGPGVDMRATAPVEKLDDPGVGLGADGWRVLSYAQLRGIADVKDMRAPGRELELHLTSNMERYMWSFDGLRFSEVEGPIGLSTGERLRLVLVNDTMMEHPVHLHGMFFELDNGAGVRRPLKHTVNIKPGEKVPLLLTADEPGDWAFHCHLLYHMEAGMMRVVRVAGGPA